MRLHRSRIHGFGPFLDGLELDLDAFEGATIVNIAGHNGAGKTTSLELALPGALFRQCPTRGSLRELAQSRDACLESVVSHNGRRYTIRHVVDAVSGKSEALVLGEDGQPLHETTKVKDFDEWARRTFPSPEVLYASMFGAQGSGGFLSAKPAERKGILLQALGLEQWERWAEEAAERAKAAKLAHASLHGQVSQLGAVDVTGAEARVAHASAHLASSEEQLTRLRATYDQEQAAITAHHQAKAAQQRAVDDVARITAQLSELETQATNLRTRKGNNEKLLEQEATIRAGLAELKQSRERLAAIELDIGTADERRKLSAQRLAAKQRESLDADRRCTASESRIADLRRELDTLDAEATTLAETVTSLTKQEEEAAVLAGEAENALHSLASTGGEFTLSRVADLREALADCAEGQGPERATAALEHDDQVVAKASSYPNDLAEAKAHRARAKKAYDIVCSNLATAKSQQATVEHRRGTLNADITRLESEVTALQATFYARTEELAQLSEEHRRLDVDLTFDHADAITELNRRITELTPHESKLVPLEAARSRIDEYTAELDRLDAKQRQLWAAKATAEEAYEAAIVGLAPEQTVTKLDVTNAERDATRWAQEQAVATAALETERGKAARLTQLTAELDAATQELEDWTRLAADLGKNGVQAAEIDLALDELNVLVNDLLHECHGPRWTVRIDTQKLSGDGKRMLETLDVFILDTVSGRDGKAETFSGGERAILSESIALALTMVACKRAGVESPTLVRDETGAALDPENARVYVAMLRKAALFTGAAHVLVVSHQQDIAELCDARIDVSQQTRRYAEAAE